MSALFKLSFFEFLRASMQIFEVGNAWVELASLRKPQIVLKLNKPPEIQLQTSEFFLKKNHLTFMINYTLWLHNIQSGCENFIVKLARSERSEFYNSKIGVLRPSDSGIYDCSANTYTISGGSSGDPCGCSSSSNSRSIGGTVVVTAPTVTMGSFHS